MNKDEREDTITLEILQTINEKNDVTQRHLASQLGVALGLANSYLKKCVRKGLVKIYQAPANRYLYYLTPKGFSEKSRLTAKFLSASFNFYRKSANSLMETYADIEKKGKITVVFCGISELTEIASLRLFEFNLIHIATYQPGASRSEFLGKPVFSSLHETSADAYVVTSLESAEDIYLELSQELEKEQIFVPSVLTL